MIENLLYVIVGFVATYLSLKVAWQYNSAYKIKEGNLGVQRNRKYLCIKQVKVVNL
jgi:hypothetical protein